MNRVILFGLIAGLGSVLAMGVFLNPGSQSGLFTSSERSPQQTIHAQENPDFVSPQNPQSTVQKRIVNDTSNFRADRNFSGNQDRKALKSVLNRRPHDREISSDSRIVSKPAVPVNINTKAKRILRKNRFRFRTLPDDQQNFSLSDLDGETHTLRDHRGEWILINFWASWCLPCREEMPSLQRLYREFKTENFSILAVNLDEPQERVRSFVRNYELTFPILLNGRSVATRYGVTTIPTTWLLNPHGKPVARLLGPLNWTKPDIIRVFNHLSSTSKNSSTGEN